MFRVTVLGFALLYAWWNEKLAMALTFLALGFLLYLIREELRR